MILKRSLHVISALMLVTGASAITYSGAEAATRPVVNKTSAMHTRVSAPVQATVPSTKREVFGFGLASSLGDPTYGYPSWNFSLLSTVAFFGLHINWDGTIASDSGMNVWNSSTLTGLTSTAHRNGTRVVLTIVLQDFHSGTPNMCAGLINRSVTVRQAVAQVATKGVDGLNVDYEGLNGICQNGQSSQAMLTDFVRQLRAALPSGSYLSVDTYAGSAADPLGFFDVSGLNAYVDSFFVMAYDLEYSNYRYPPQSCSSFCLGPTAPLTGYRYNDTTTVSQYMSVVSRSKVILGVPYYGRKSCVSGAAPNAYPASSVTADAYLDASGEKTAPGVTNFATHRDANDPTGRERWDTWFNSSMNCTRELYWDDPTSLGAKYDLVNADNLRGVGIWTLNYGGAAPELWAALSSHFVACATVSLGASPSSSASVGTKVSVVATAAGCPDPNPLYQFWILPPRATSWQMVQAYSTSGTFSWNTGGAAAGIYQVGVWVRDSRSQGVLSNSFGRRDASISSQYTLYSTPCSAAAVSASPTAGGASVTAHASGCPNPLYEFWTLPPGATSWKMAQAYAANPTWEWNTTGAAAGTYILQVWARDLSSAGTNAAAGGRWDAYASTRYTVPCSAVTLTVSPPTGAQVGAIVTVTARASRCVSPLYEFWILAPGASSWQLSQAYSTTPTLRWNTSGANPGLYAVQVWVRDANSAGVYGNRFGRSDAYASSLYALKSSACSSVTVSSSPSGSASVGTTVTLTARASGCPSPLYEFWIIRSGASSWQIVQVYSSNAAWLWNTSLAAKGTYLVQVWVRDLNSAGRWDAYGSSQFTLN